MTNGWVKLDVTMLPAQIVYVGPTMLVQINTPGATDSLEARALIDTGASHSCLSPGLAQKLGAAPVGSLLQQELGREPENVPIFRCEITFSTELRIRCDLAMLVNRHTSYEIIIGRDILRFGRFVVDFTSGCWELHLDCSKLRPAFPANSY